MRIEVLGTIFFFAAVIHTFLTAPILNLSHRYPKDGFRAGVLHFLGEIEVVFGIWAGLFLLTMAALQGVSSSVEQLEGTNFVEPLFVFTIMAICSTRPILEFCRSIIVVLSRGLKRVFRAPEIHTEIFVILAVGPLAGSFITEPAAMTVTALLLFSMIHTRHPKVLYGMLGVLFVNISIGGSLTPYAAPPILMVASAWGWDFNHVISTLGWKAAIAVVVNSLAFVFFFRKSLAAEFYTLKHLDQKDDLRRPDVPFSITALHLAFLLAVVIFAHHEKVFIGLLLFFLGVYEVTKKHQSGLRLRESLLVAFFLGGIIIFGPFQAWWLKPLLASLGDGALFVGAAALTAITDNAALTYLGSQVEGLSDASKFALVAGALAGGGLTVIANAPNPAGVSILQSKFPEGRIAPLALLVGALAPTLVALLCLWLLPGM